MIWSLSLELDKSLSWCNWVTAWIKRLKVTKQEEMRSEWLCRQLLYGEHFSYLSYFMWESNALLDSNTSDAVQNSIHWSTVCWCGLSPVSEKLSSIMFCSEVYAGNIIIFTVLYSNYLHRLCFPCGVFWLNVTTFCELMSWILIVYAIEICKYSAPPPILCTKQGTSRVYGLLCASLVLVRTAGCKHSAMCVTKCHLFFVLLTWHYFTHFQQSARLLI